MTRLQRFLLPTFLLAAATLCHAETAISGAINTTTWTKANGPYTIDSDITVPAGNTLTIEAGVDVLFDSDVPFVVEGVLRALGTATDSIRFLPGEAPEWGGIRLISTDSSSLTYTRISGGHAEGDSPTGGGVHAEARLGMDHCVVSGNSAAELGGGVYIGGPSVTLSNSTIAGNTALSNGGGVYVASSVVSLTRCTLLGNSSSAYGGGLYSYSSTAALTNCTVTGNSAASGGAGLVNFAPTVSFVLLNSILWGNDPGELVGTMVATYSCVRGGYPGTGNIDSDPLFVDAASGDVSLQAGSPCIDAGTLLILDEDESASDMGATGGGITALLARMELSATELVAWTGSPGTLRIGNSGAARLQVSLDLPDLFASPVEFPRFVAPGETLSVPVTYSGAADVETQASLSSSDPFMTSVTIALAGRKGIGVGDTILTATWTDQDEDYRVAGPVVVPQGQVLTVEAGVNVVFDADVPFVVQGALRVHGTESDSVRFRPGQATEWGGIRISGNDSSSFVFAVITGGHVDGDGESGYGGGVYCSGTGTRVTLLNCSAKGNGALRGGALYNNDATVLAIGCTFSGNSGVTYGAGVHNFYGTMLLEDCVIAGNGRPYCNSGGGVMNELGAMTLTECSITDNECAFYGGGVCTGNGITTIDRCVISGNSANYGGGIVTRSDSLRLTRSFIGGNSATASGGGIYHRDGEAIIDGCIISGNSSSGPAGGLFCDWDRFDASTVRLTNCTLYGNTASTEGGGVFNDYRSYSKVTLEVLNCIVWGNAPESISGTTDVDYSCVEGGWFGGTGNTSANPLMADPARGDHSLRTGSPCIDAGDPSLTDPDGSRSDIGASSYDGPVSVATGRALAFDLRQNLPNPFNPVTTIPYAIAEAGPVTLSVYNLQGQLVRTLVQEIAQPGEYAAVWDGRDVAGRAAASGVYLYRLVAPEGVRTMRMTLVR